MQHKTSLWLVAAVSLCFIGCGSDGIDGSPGAPGADGAPGTSSAARVTAASAEQCADGGSLVEFGLDADGDGQLSDAEVSSSTLVCNGESGEDGTMGQDGMAGSDGLNSLILATAEPAGANCSAGGIRVDVGTDDDGDGVLGMAEIDATEYVCDGVDGTNSLTVATPEPAGANCADGGQRIDIGTDADGSGTLNASEVTSTAYVCDGANAAATLVEASTEPAGANCASGGIRVDIGQDNNEDSVLDAGEVLQTTYVCNGTDGLNSLVRVSDEPQGANCATGGVRIDVGLDDDASQTLEAAEIDDTAYICSAGGLVALSSSPDVSTVFNNVDACYLFTNNLITSFWDPVSGLIFTGDFNRNGYWAFAPATAGWTSAPDQQTGLAWGRMQLVPSSRVVVGGRGSSGYRPLAASAHWIANMDNAGQISGRQTAVFSDGFTGTCDQSSISSTEYLCYDGTAIRHYSTVSNSATLTFVKSVALATQPVSNDGYGASFAWDGEYYYFAGGDLNNSTTPSYRVYRSDGSVEGNYTATGNGAINAPFFDWNIGRYSIHDGFGGRRLGTIYTGLSGGSDSHCFGPPSPYHSGAN